MKHFTLTKAYISWVSVFIIAWIISWQTGELWDLMGQAVDLSGAQTYDASRNEMIIGFIVISLIYWFITVLISGVFVLFTNKQKPWAKYLLSLFCLYQIIYEVYINVETIQSYDISFAIHDWILAISSIIFLVYMGIRPHVKSISSRS
ncbi:hypothetical protein MNBD_GAMMA26-852 [hydrothermal vent metagenome]|uniref:DUF2569 domain-containing protein n=1 Tax=hydrothermal vent metagenome TaxID=652676 RepID=A0A3B1B8N6_9ZZZZ